jgi:hypothetical protein|tara:strand:+ start:2467 stop:2991 length:525 start_codon:yes stop_codon:yes gene_type:complete
MSIKGIGLAVLITVFLSNFSFGQKKKVRFGNSDPEEIIIKESCTFKVTAEKIKVEIAPFKLEKITPAKIHYKAYTQVKEVAIPIYHTTQYKFVINAEGMATGVEMKITDKPHKVSGSKVLSQSTSKTFTYETPSDFEGSRIYLSVKIPGDAEFNNHIRNRGCILIGTGFEDVDF